MKKIPREINLISVIVPVFSKEKTITKDLRRIYQVLQKLRYKAELICVIDGKIDKSFEKASNFAKKYPNVKVYGYETNKGKGYAVRFGMSKSRGEIVGFIDSGMDLNPNGLAMLLEHFEWYEADIIVGSKRHTVSKVSYPWQRRVLSLGYQILARLLFGLKVRDTQVGMKFFRRRVLEKVLPRLLIKKFAFDIEILAVANYLGFKRIFEAPVDIRLELGGTSSVTNKRFLAIAMRMMIDTLAVFYRLKILRFYADTNKRRWRFDPELNFRINIG